MSNRILLAAVMLVVAVAANAAEGEPEKQQCPTLDHQEIEDLLRKASSCQRAAALFEICQFGSSGDVSFGALVTQKCQGDFLSKLTAAQKRAYDDEQKGCRRKYLKEDGSMYRSFEAVCGADVASNYSAKFLKGVRAGRN
jgi:hypothetical protein